MENTNCKVRVFSFYIKRVVEKSKVFVASITSAWFSTAKYTLHNPLKKLDFHM